MRLGKSTIGTGSKGFINVSFSEMFRKRQDENMVEFSFKEKDRTLSFNNTKDCCCSTQA